MNPALQRKLEIELDAQASKRTWHKRAIVILVILILVFFYVGDELGFLDMFQNALVGGR
jgi:hypothetical protein